MGEGAHLPHLAICVAAPMRTVAIVTVATCQLVVELHVL